MVQCTQKPSGKWIFFVRAASAAGPNEPRIAQHPLLVTKHFEKQGPTRTSFQFSQIIFVYPTSFFPPLSDTYICFHICFPEVH